MTDAKSKSDMKRRNVLEGKPIETTPKGFDVSELIGNMHGATWAQRFVELHGGDFEIMVGWFANAIMAGYDTAMNRKAETTPKSFESELVELIKIQKQNLTDEYMRGMANGLICAHSVLTGQEPEYVNAPKTETPPAVAPFENRCYEKAEKYYQDFLAKNDAFLNARTRWMKDDFVSGYLEALQECHETWTKVFQLTTEGETLETAELKAKYNFMQDSAQQNARERDAALKRIAELEHQLSLPKVPQPEEIRALTKRIVELDAELSNLVAQSTKDRAVLVEAMKSIAEEDDGLNPCLEDVGSIAREALNKVGEM